MDMQKKLEFLTREEIKDVVSPRLRGVAAVWKDQTAHISFFFDGEINVQDRDKASDACTYIISHFPDGLLEEHYIRLDYPKALPEDFLVYNNYKK